MTTEPRLLRPGFGLPLEQLPPWSRDGKKERFPHAIADFFATSGVTARERRMLDFVNQITDKPRWWEKVHDEVIVGRWRAEACGNEEQQRLSDKHLDGKCFEYCIAELRDKARYWPSRGVVHVLDIDATVVKADLNDTEPFWTSLSQSVRPLEDVPDRLKDWHPGSDGLVLDLLHPSLFPLEYGVSRVLPTGKVPLNRCVEYTGLGEICPVPSVIQDGTRYERHISWQNTTNLLPWGTYQWLPSEVTFDNNGVAKIDSYINNLHPDVHQPLYEVLSKAVDKAVPLWEECLSWSHDRTRLLVDGCGYEDMECPTYPGLNDEDMEGADEQEREWQREDHYRDYLHTYPEEARVVQPSPTQDYVPLEQIIEEKGLRRLDLRSDFRDGLQIIFKLATIHLTPEQPQYSGSNWHVEGALNEHICATALFYYDSGNVTDSYLEFRQHADAEDMVMKPQQNEWRAAELLFGVENEGTAIQHLGKVLTRPGRMLAFPNVLQHQVSPFGLEDSSKPGHRKILAMFLVDPHIRILSTANVPPQRLDWWAEEVRKIQPFSGLPVELFDRIMEGVEEFPVSWGRACEVREALMAERGRAGDEYNEMLEEDTFYFCEH